MNQRRPSPSPASQVVLCLRAGELKVYGNASAFRSIAEQLLWLAESEPKSNFECHVRLTMENATRESCEKGFTRFCADELATQYLTNVSGNSNAPDDGTVEQFELTFMMLDAPQFDELAQ